MPRRARTRLRFCMGARQRARMGACGLCPFPCTRISETPAVFRRGSQYGLCLRGRQNAPEFADQAIANVAGMPMRVRVETVGVWPLAESALATQKADFAIDGVARKRLENAACSLRAEPYSEEGGDFPN